MDIGAWKASVDNGQIPLSKLARIEPVQYDPDLGGPALMHPEAADAMSAMLREARLDDRPFRVLLSYRTLAEQWDKWRDYQNGGVLAAYPGTSNHGWALADDLTDLGELDIYWLRNNARHFGYVNDVPGEVWHWTYYGGWNGESEDDVNLEKYVDGEALYRQRYKEQGKDPGPPPDERDRWFKAGWNSARFAASNPRG